MTPGALLFLLHKANKMPRFIPNIITEFAFLSAFLIIGLPLSMAAFNMQGKVKANELGGEFAKEAKDKTLYFNKGF